MSEKSIEMMKKLIEEKKNKSSKQGSKLRPGKITGTGAKKAIRNTKKGGLFD